jgi:hypothetical protein
MASSQLPPKVVKKFHPDGSSKAYLGHSIICRLPQHSPLADTLRKLRTELSEHTHSGLFRNEALLPESSWHMTVFIGVRDLERGAHVMPREGYATDIKNRSGLEGPYNEWLAYTTQQVRGIVLQQQMRPPYSLLVERSAPEIDYSIGLRLRATSDTEVKLEHLRQQLAQQIGITPPSNYVFHVTLAYLLRDPTTREAQELKALVETHLANAPQAVEFPEVALCSFENMQGFNPEVFI